MSIVNYSSDLLGPISYDDTMFKIDVNDFLRYIGPDKGKPDQPIGLTNYFYMFYDREDLTSIDLSDWDMSNVEEMSCMFQGCTSLKDISSLSNCDTSKLKYMRCMFNYCTSLVDISALKDWDVSSVENMFYMFNYCTSLVDISALKDWDVSNVNSMINMFICCTSLKELPEWYK